MNKKFLFSLFALFVVFFGVTMWPVIFLKEEKKTLNMEYSPDSLSQVQIIGSDSVTLLKDINGFWNLTAPVEYPADQNYVLAIVNAVSKITANSIATTNSESYASYGIDEGSRTEVIVTTENESYRFFVGATALSGSYTYILIPDDPAVYMAEGSFRDSILRGVDGLRESSIFGVTSDDISSIELVRNDTEGGSLVIFEDGSYMGYQGETVLDLDNSKVQEYFSNFGFLQASDFYDEPVDLSEENLLVSAVITRQSGEELVFTIHSYGDDQYILTTPESEIQFGITSFSFEGIVTDISTLQATEEV